MPRRRFAIKPHLSAKSLLDPSSASRPVPGPRTVTLDLPEEEEVTDAMVDAVRGARRGGKIPLIILLGVECWLACRPEAIASFVAAHKVLVAPDSSSARGVRTLCGREDEVFDYLERTYAALEVERIVRGAGA